MVYFLRAGSLIKIGTSRDVQKRILDLQNMNHDKLELVALDNITSERKYHEEFAQFRSHGEWFWWCDEIENRARFLKRDGGNSLDVMIETINKRIARVFWRPRSVVKRQTVQELLNERKKKLEHLRKAYHEFPPGLSARDRITRWRGRWAVSTGRGRDRVATSFPLDTPVEVMRQWQAAPLRNKRGKGIPYPSPVPQPVSEKIAPVAIDAKQDPFSGAGASVALC